MIFFCPKGDSLWAILKNSRIHESLQIRQFVFYRKIWWHFPQVRLRLYELETFNSLWKFKPSPGKSQKECRRFSCRRPQSHGCKDWRWFARQRNAYSRHRSCIPSGERPCSMQFCAGQGLFFCYLQNEYIILSNVAIAWAKVDTLDKLKGMTENCQVAIPECAVCPPVPGEQLLYGRRIPFPQRPVLRWFETGINAAF